MDPNQIQAALAQKRQDLGQRTADVANVFQQYNPVNDSVVQGLRSNQAEKLKQLFSHDQQLADVTFQPQASAQVPGEVSPEQTPRLIDPTIGFRASSQQTTATAGEMGDLLTQIANRKDTLSTERDKALAMIDNIIKTNQLEQSSLEKQMDWYFKTKDQELERAKLSKGSERDQAQGKIRGLIQDAQMGITLSQALRKYGDAIDPQQIYEVYNTSSKWGTVKAKPEELAPYGIKAISSAAGGATMAREQLKKQTGMDVISSINTIDSSIKKQTGGANAYKVYSLMNNPASEVTKSFVTGKNDVDLQDLESKYFLIVQSVLTAIQGSRPSDYDVRSWQQKVGPSILLKSDVNDSRIKNLLNIVSSGGTLKDLEKSSNNKPTPTPVGSPQKSKYTIIEVK